MRKNTVIQKEIENNLKHILICLHEQKREWKREIDNIMKERYVYVER